MICLYTNSTPRYICTLLVPRSQGLVLLVSKLKTECVFSTLAVLVVCLNLPFSFAKSIYISSFFFLKLQFRYMAADWHCFYMICIL
ncbi:hypothetical protein SORBI_3009G239250 [Sorghum bicolor]|uniref:Uncharacterized protein n=1 Tax=Sorghum bicolor TaxID=4558 RepID=A0A1Z5R3V3_SORBI|nr:hypothetical protein SORBI_3009G239250 [Sorghum bicolor]